MSYLPDLFDYQQQFGDQGLQMSKIITQLLYFLSLHNTNSNII